MTSNEITGGSVDFKDRKTGLVVFGIIQILIGAFCAIMVLFMLLGMFAIAGSNDGSASPVNSSMMLPGILFYIPLAVWFISMGIGSIRSRRWARALVLISSWLWLISGTGGMIFMLFSFPEMYEQMSNGGEMPRQIANVVMYITIGFMGVFYVIIPGAFVLFYGSRHVKATCERRDPQIRWTDKCPLPVLAISFVAAVWAFCAPLAGFYGWAVPFFGTILSGAAGVAVMLLGMLLFGCVAWGTYRLSVKAWWGALLLVVAWGTSAGITFSRVSLMEYYEKMNFPEQQLELMKDYPMAQASTTVLLSVLWVLVAVAYLLYVRRYFLPPSEELNTSQGEQM